MSGKSFMGVPYDTVETEFAYVADGDIPQDTVDVMITVTVPGQNVKPLKIPIQVLPYPIIVTMTPPLIAPGDTATISMKQRNPDGTISDFSTDQLFEVGISTGEGYGTILSSDGIDTAGYFLDIPSGFKFIAVDSIDADSVMVGIRVGIPSQIISSSARRSGNAAFKQSMSAAKMSAGSLNLPRRADGYS